MEDGSSLAQGTTDDFSENYTTTSQDTTVAPPEDTATATSYTQDYDEQVSFD